MSSLGPEAIAELGFEQVVRDAPVAISVIDAAGRVIHSNARAQELTIRQLGYEMPLRPRWRDRHLPSGRKAL
jgi:PAS domain-containing protein